MSILQPSVPLVTPVKTEPPTVIKNEPPEEALKKEISLDIKDIDFVYHSLSEDLIKNENAPENILETKYSESVKTQVLVKTEDTSDENVTRGTDQEMIEVQGSQEHSNTLSNLETHEQLVNSFKDLNGTGTRIRKEKHAKKTDFARCYKADGTTSWEKEKEKIKIIPVESHEYTSLAEGEYVCNHCQHAYKGLYSLKFHIKKMHREVTTMYQCPYCPYKSKWSITKHIILKHKDTKDIQWFQCHLCEKKFKFKCNLTQHLKVHLTHDKIEFCPVCGKGFTQTSFANRHMKFVHNKEERNKVKRKCRYCEYTTTERKLLKHHIKNTHKNYEKSYHCDNCDYKTDDHHNLKRHKVVHLKPEDIEYFYCYHCSYKSKRKIGLKNHIFMHCKNVELKREKRAHLKPEEVQYFYCYHCSYKAKRKGNLKGHIFIHFKKEQVKFDCYICNFTTQKRETIIEHIKKHSKAQIKFEINEGS